MSEGITIIVATLSLAAWIITGVEGANYHCRRYDNWPPGDLHIFVGAFLGPFSWVLPFFFSPG